jgi:hypothetical protein
MICETISGSRYEIDLPGKRARRVYGLAPATERMPDRVWRTFLCMVPNEGPYLGQCMFFEWADESVGPAAVDGARPCTVTTQVMRVCD